MEQNKQPSGQPRKPEQQPRQTYRKQSQPKSPQGRRPQPKKKQQPNLRLALAACGWILPPPSAPLPPAMPLC